MQHFLCLHTILIKKVYLCKRNMNMDKNIDNRDNVNLLQHREEFETVYGIISAHKKRAMSAMHNESLNMLWEVGAYVSDRLKKAENKAIVPIELTHIVNDAIVSFEMAQIPSVLFSTGWTNHFENID